MRKPGIGVDKPGSAGFTPWMSTRNNAVLVLLLLCGCAIGRSAPFEEAPRPAIDVPARFVLDPTDPDSSTGAGVGQGCRSPLFDPRDATRIRLVRSAGGRGDYEVPSGRYGASSRELIRLDCATGSVVGIVSR
jgi:hypothetical protein